MTTPTKILWLALPATVGVALWLAADRLATAATRTDFWILAGVLAVTVVDESLLGFFQFSLLSLGDPHPVHN